MFATTQWRQGKPYMEELRAFFRVSLVTPGPILKINGKIKQKKKKKLATYKSDPVTINFKSVY